MGPLDRNFYENVFPGAPPAKTLHLIFTPIPHPEARTAERLGTTPEMPPMTTVTPLRSVRRRSTAPGGQRQNTCQRCFPPHLCASFFAFYKTMHYLLQLLVFFFSFKRLHTKWSISPKKKAVLPPWFFLGETTTKLFRQNNMKITQHPQQEQLVTCDICTMLSHAT